MSSKAADLAGPGIGNYEDLEKILPLDYSSALSRRETQKAIFAVKRFIEDNLCKELNLLMVTVPLIVDIASGVNDMLDRDGSRTPIQFHIRNDYDKHPVDAQIVQAATKWKRVALKEFVPVKAFARTCAPSAKTISSTMTIASTWTSGIGSAPSPPISATSTS